MLNLLSFLILLFIPIIQCVDVSVSFPTFPVNTDIGYCTCDLTSGQCDASCCCDPDCTAGDQTVFGCSSRDNQYTKNLVKEIHDRTTGVVSTVQPTCFKNISIFQSNSPYIIQKMGELVCVDYARYTGSQYYPQPNINTLDPVAFVQAIDLEDNVTPPLALPTNLTTYSVGTPVLSFKSSLPGYFTLPVNLLESPLCSGTQSITYMNDFTSICNQVVSSSTCTGGLSPTTYVGPLCLIRSPANPSDSSTYICDNTAATAATFTSATSICTGFLRSLVITVSYSNPTGIVGVSAAASIDTTAAGVASGTVIQQTFTVQFVQSGSTASSTTRNPGYLQGASIPARLITGSVIDTTVTPVFSILRPLSTGLCGSATDVRIAILFGENVQSTCEQAVTASTCPDLHTLFMPVQATNLYVAAYSNPNYVNASTDWLPVITCTSEAGSPDSRLCQLGLLVNLLSTGVCYIRLDIQIAYTNIGTVSNPQPVLSAVIFHYQRISTSTTSLPSTLLVTETVTFQDISNAPIVAQGQIPTPNTQLPANFFYPFSVSHASKSMTSSLFSYFLISILFILM